MNILLYELRKLLSNKTFIYLSICLIVINIFLVYADISKSDSLSVKNHQIYNEVKENLPENKLDYLQEKIIFYNTINEYEQNYDDSFSLVYFDNEISNFDTEFITNYNIFITSDEYEKMYIYYDIYCNLYDYYLNIENYNDYVIDVLDNVETYSSGILSKNMSEDNKLTLKKEGEYFDKLKDVYLKDINYLGINLFIESFTSTILMFIAIILLVFYCFYVDENINIDSILKITKKGRWITAIAKNFAILIIAIILQIVFIITSLIMYQIVFLPIDFSAPIQSIPLLYESPYNITISEFLMFTTLIKVFAITCITSMFLMIYKLFKNKIVIVFVYIIILTVSLLFYLNIEFVDYNNILKFINLFTFMNANTYLMVYKGYTILFYQSIITWIIVLFSLVMFLSIIIYLIFYNTKKETKIRIKMPNFKILYSHTNLLLHELYKLLITNRILIVIVCLLFVQLYFYNQSKLPDYQMQYEHKINESFREFGGFMTDEKKAIIIEKDEYYKQKYAEMNEVKKQYNDNKINDTEYSNALEEYIKDTKDLSYFSSVIKKYGGQDYLLNSKGYRSLFAFESIQREIRSSLFVILSIIVLLFSIYTSDYNGCNKTIYDITINGRKTKLNNRLIITIIGCVIIVLVYSFLEFNFINSMYSLDCWNAPLKAAIQITENFKTLPAILKELPFYVYYFFVIVIRLFGAITAGLIVLFISFYNKKSIFSIIISIVILVVPLLLFLMDIVFIIPFSLFDMIMGNECILNSLSYSKILFYLILDVMIIIKLKNKVKNK